MNPVIKRVSSTCGAPSEYRENEKSSMFNESMI